MIFEVLAIVSSIMLVMIGITLFVLNKKFKETIANLIVKNDIKVENIKASVIEQQKVITDAITDVAVKDREDILTIIKSYSEMTEEIIQSQNQRLDKLAEDNRQLKKKLEFFTEIDTDSKKLNDIENYAEQENTLETALAEVKEKLGRKDGEVKPELENSSIQGSDTAEFILSSTNDVVENNESILDPDQERAFFAMENSTDNLFITGKAGTGKSFLLKLFEKSTKKRTLKVSPTGVAALNIGGTTMHSAFGYNNLEKRDIEDLNIKTLELKEKNKIVLQDIEMLIIDEVSMVRADMLDKIDKILRLVNNNDKVFGGKQVLIFGDLFQLPPVAESVVKRYLKDKYGGIFFFFSNSYKAGDFRFIELGKNHRQKQDNHFFEILNRMREGSVSDYDISIINKRLYKNEEDLVRIVRLFPTKAKAKTVNETELEKIPARAYSFKANVIRNKTDRQPKIENDLPISENLILKRGALVMMVNNDIDKRWVNGTLGIVSFLSEQSIKVKIDGVEHDVPKFIFEYREPTLKNNHIEYEVVLEVEQYPLVLAYAITIHKSQGMTYQRIACDITGCFASGQAYVALSRCSSLEGLFLLQEITSAGIAVDADVREFYLKIKNDSHHD